MRSDRQWPTSMQIRARSINAPHLSLELDRYKRSRSLARQIRSQARKTLSNYILSTFKLRQRGNPYQITFIDSVAAFYSALRTNTPLDTRIAGDRGRDVVRMVHENNSGRRCRTCGDAQTAPSKPTHGPANCSRPRGNGFYWSRVDSPTPGSQLLRASGDAWLGRGT